MSSSETGARAPYGRRVPAGFNPADMTENLAVAPPPGWSGRDDRPDIPGRRTIRLCVDDPIVGVVVLGEVSWDEGTGGAEGGEDWAPTAAAGNPGEPGGHDVGAGDDRWSDEPDPTDSLHRLLSENHRAGNQAWAGADLGMQESSQYALDMIGDGWLKDYQWLITVDYAQVARDVRDVLGGSGRVQALDGGVIMLPTLHVEADPSAALPSPMAGRNAGDSKGTVPPPIDLAGLPPGPLSRADYERVGTRNRYLAGLYDPESLSDRALNLVTGAMNDPARVLTPAERAEHAALNAKLRETLFPAPTPQEARLDAMLNSPIGAAASVIAGALGFGQQTQDWALGLGGLVDAGGVARGLAPGRPEIPEPVRPPLTEERRPGSTSGFPDLNRELQRRSLDPLHSFSPEQSAMVEELKKAGVKFSPEKIIGIDRDKDGRIVFLEQGGPESGLDHILTDHGADLERKGISKDKVPDLLFQTLKNGIIVGYQGRGSSRPIYEIIFEGRRIRLAITVGSNGYIVGVNLR